jgi:hypothetical protein
MSSFVSFLLALVKLAGVKLPLIWPHLLHIASDLAEIARILGVETVNPSFQESKESAELKALCSDHGVDCTELAKVSGALDAAVAE